MGFIRFVLIFSFCSLFSGIAFSAEESLELEPLLKNGKWKEVGDLLNKELVEAQKEEVNLKAKRDKVLKQEGNITNTFSSESESKGIILTFNDWPVNKERESILQKLAEAQLTKESEIERFKVWIYKWTDLKKKAEAEKVCSILLQYLSLKRCDLDYQLDLAVYSVSISTLEEFVEKAKSAVQKAREAVETTRQALEVTEERARRILDQMTEDRGLAIEKKRVRKAKAALVAAKKKLERVVQAGKNDKVARWNVQHLEKLVVSRKKRVENRKKWFGSTKEYVTDNQNRLIASRKRSLQSAESWLQYLLQLLAKRERQLADARAEYANRNNNQEKKNTQSSASSNRANKNITSNTKSASSPGAVSNLKTCNIVSSQLRLPDPDDKNTLTDYWAQEMVGADLLKEEVEKADPIKKKIVETFDTREDGHASKVRNVISHQGPHSVLPELGDNINTSHVRYVSDILKVSDRLLSKADESCKVSNAGRYK